MTIDTTKLRRLAYGNKIQRVLCSPPNVWSLIKLAQVWPRKLAPFPTVMDIPSAKGNMGRDQRGTSHVLVLRRRSMGKNQQAHQVRHIDGVRCFGARPKKTPG